MVQIVQVVQVVQVAYIAVHFPMHFFVVRLFVFVFVLRFDLVSVLLVVQLQFVVVQNFFYQKQNQKQKTPFFLLKNK